MNTRIRRAAAAAGSCAVAFTLATGHRAEARRPLHRAPHAARPHAAPPAADEELRLGEATVSPTWPQYDEIRLVTDRGIMSAGRYFSPASPISPAAFLESLRRLRIDYLHHGLTVPSTLPTIPAHTATLTREQAVDLLVKTLVPPSTEPTWDADTLNSAVLDLGDTSAPYAHSVALAAERLYLPNPLRPKDVADKAFAAQILARALPPNSARVNPGPFSDEIRKALDLHLLYVTGTFPDGAPVTTGELARAIDRARMYLPHDLWLELPPLPVDSTDRTPLTRAGAINLMVTGMVADSRFNTRLAVAGTPVVDPDARVAFALGPQMYLSNLQDANTIPPQLRGAVAVAAYKGWLPNLSSEPGKLDVESPASLGYVANLLARSVNRPGDPTGIVIDMSSLKPLERAGGMWILNAGDSPDKEVTPQTVYPSSAHLPVRPFFSAPGALAFYGSLDNAEMGRAGQHPLVIKPLDWARYDWTTLHGDPGLRRGGGVKVPLDGYHFVHGTPPLILISPDDAKKLEELDHRDLLLRTARIALVQPNYSLTAMR